MFLEFFDVDTEVLVAILTTLPPMSDGLLLLDGNPIANLEKVAWTELVQVLAGCTGCQSILGKFVVEPE